MLWNSLFSSLMYVADFFLNLIPNFIQTPTPVVELGRILGDQLTFGASVLQYIYTPVLFGLIIIMLIAFITFDWWWALSWWSLKKIPVVGRWIDK